MEQRFWVRLPTGVQGPFPVSRIQAWIAEGRMRPEMEFSEDGANYFRGTEIQGLFPTREPAPIAPRRSRLQALREAQAVGRTPPPPGPALACRVAVALLLVGAWVVGQWAHASAKVIEGPLEVEVRVVFGLHSLEAAVGRDPNWASLAKLSFSSVKGGDVGTTIMLGWVLTLLVAASILVCAAAVAEAAGRRLPFLGLATLIGPTLIAVIGFVYTRTGMVSDFRSLLAAQLSALDTGTTSSSFPGMSYWLSLVSVVFAAVAFFLVRSADSAAEARARRGGERQPALSVR